MTRASQFALMTINLCFQTFTQTALRILPPLLLNPIQEENDDEEKRRSFYSPIVIQNGQVESAYKRVLCPQCALTISASGLMNVRLQLIVCILLKFFTNFFFADFGKHHVVEHFPLHR